jgi:hypothetical protein
MGETEAQPDLAAVLANERLAHDVALVAQEQRVIPAIRNLFEIFFRRPSTELSALVPSALSALARCIPSAGNHFCAFGGAAHTVCQMATARAARPPATRHTSAGSK